MRIGASRDRARQLGVAPAEIVRELVGRQAPPSCTAGARAASDQFEESRYRADLSAEERIRQMDEFAENNSGLPVLSDEAFDRDSLYGNEEAHR